MLNFIKSNILLTVVSVVVTAIIAFFFPEPDPAVLAERAAAASAPAPMPSAFDQCVERGTRSITASAVTGFSLQDNPTQEPAAMMVARMCHENSASFSGG